MDTGEDGAAFCGMVLDGTYRLVERLGRGGMGDVFLGEHVRLGSPVAIKLLRRSTEHERSRQRFLQEAKALASIHSDNVVRVFDYGESCAGIPYLVMERLFGEDLRALLTREGRLPVRRAVRLAMNVCRGLFVAHAAGLVHRDLKPANLFVESVNQSTERCKILDFGVAKEVASDATYPGTLLGTIRYMAPEQLEDAKSVTARADIYALGAILFEALSGRPANAGRTNAEIMFHSLHGDAPRLGDHVVVPSELETIVSRALSRKPSERFSSVEEFERALARFGPTGPVIAATVDCEVTTIADGPRAPVERRNLRQAGWVVVGAFGLGAAGGWLTRAFDGTSPAAASVASINVPRLVEGCPSVDTVAGGAVRVPEASREASARPLTTMPNTEGVLKPGKKGLPRRSPPDSIITRFDSENPYR
jgi:serine/threonine protein kinase